MAPLRNALEAFLQWLLIFLMIILTVIVMVAVVYRKMDASLSWYDEVASVLMAWITYYGGALAALRRAHMGFDGLLLAMPRSLRAVAVVIGEILVISFFVLLAWAGWRVLQVVGDESLVSLPWVSITLTQSVIPIGAVLFIICELLSLPEYWRAVMSGKSLAHSEAHGDAHAGADTAGKGA